MFLKRREAACVDVQSPLLRDKVKAFQERDIHVERKKKRRLPRLLEKILRKGAEAWKSLWS